MWYRESSRSLPLQDKSQHSRQVLQSSIPIHQGDQQRSPASRPCSQATPPNHVFAIIWRSSDQKSSPLLQQGPNRQIDIAHHSELVTDPQFDDWHIVVSPIKVPSPTSTGTSPSRTLCERFASSTCDSKAWYLRCGHSELPDMAAWLIWQRLEHSTITRQPSWSLLTDDDVDGQLTDQELAMCKRSLFNLFDSRSVEQIQLALLAIYFVTNSFRDLSFSELTAAVRSTASSRSNCETQLAYDAVCWSADDQLLEVCSPFLTSGRDGRVAFRDPSMKKFMSLARLPGLEHGHGTMTQICFEQIRQLGTTFIVRPWVRFRKWFKSCRRWPLMKYVAKYWFCHYQQAAASRMDLSAELFRMINTALSGHSPAETPVLLQQRIINTGYGISQVYELPELAAIYRNMGASGFDDLKKAPSPDQWQHMIPMFGIKIPAQTYLDNEATVSEVFDARSILCLREDTAAAIISPFRNLHLQPQDDSDEVPVDDSHCFQSLPGHTDIGIHDWQVIDIKELEQAMSHYEDWELVHQEGTSDSG